MAKEEKGKDAKGRDDVEVDKDGEGEDGAGKKKKKKLVLIISIVVGSIVLLSAIIGTTVYLVGGKNGADTEQSQTKKGKKGKKAEDAAEEEAADESEADAESADGEGEDEGDGEGDGEEGPKTANYSSLDPPFVVNFEGTGPARFLQISVEVMSRDPVYAEHIKKHMPVIRNNLVLLFSSMTYDKVNTLKGKEELRTAALAEVQKILEEETGDPGVEALYFTSFVMQ